MNLFLQVEYFAIELRIDNPEIEIEISVAFIFETIVSHRGRS